MAELVLEEFDATASGLTANGRQRGDDARDLHHRRAIWVGLGLHRDRPAGRLDGIIGRTGPKPGDGQPRLRSLVRTAQHLAEDRHVGEQLRALAGDRLQAAERGQGLGQPPIGGSLQRRFKLETVGRVGWRRLE